MPSRSAKLRTLAIPERTSHGQLTIRSDPPRRRRRVDGARHQPPHHVESRLRAADRGARRRVPAQRAAFAAGQDGARARAAGPDRRAALGQPARKRVPPGRRRDAADPTARRAGGARGRCEGRQDRARRAVARRFQGRRPDDAARGGRRARALQGERQAGGGVGVELRPAAVLPGRACERSAVAPDGRGLPRRLRRATATTTAKRSTASASARTCCAWARTRTPAKATPRPARRRNRSSPRAICTTHCGQPTPTVSSRPASLRAGSIKKGIDEIAVALRRGRWRRREARARKQARRCAEDARRVARAADRARREGRGRQELPAGVVRGLPGAPVAARRAATRSASSSPKATSSTARRRRERSAGCRPRS